MLEAVGHPHAVNPDKELRRVATRPGLAGAGVHQARRAAQPGPAAPAKPTLAALAVGGVVAVGGAIWINLRRRNSSA